MVEGTRSKGKHKEEKISQIIMRDVGVTYSYNKE